MTNNITLRPAVLEDTKMLLDWENGESPSSTSYITDVTHINDHVVRLSTLPQTSNCQLFIAEEHGRAIGAVRGDFLNGVWDISWTVAPDAKGCGLAKTMVSTLMSYINSPSRAEVKENIIASIKDTEFAEIALDNDSGTLRYKSDTPHSTDYHDYVFKDGKFIGAFEDMYKYATDVPWHQDTVPDTWHGRLGTCVIDAAFADGPIRSVIEVGCGYGHILSRLAAGKTISAAGFDVSQTAIEKAKRLHPEHTFFVDELVNMKHLTSYDLVICREVLWYVIDKLDAAIENLARLTAKGKYLYIGLSFPNLEGAYVGKGVIQNPSALIEKLERYFDSIVINNLIKKDSRRTVLICIGLARGSSCHAMVRWDKASVCSGHEEIAKSGMVRP